MTSLPFDGGLKLILGSGSPRRLELLAQMGVTPHAVRPPDIDEDPRKAELPRDYVKRIASEKAAAVLCADDEVVLCADTTVALGRRIMGKPANAGEAAGISARAVGSQAQGDYGCCGETRRQNLAARCANNRFF